MKKLLFLLMLCGIGVGSIYADGDVTATGDHTVGIPNDGRWPGGELPDYAIDDDANTKYLHYDFRTDNIPGIIIVPTTDEGEGTVVQGVTFTSANDASGRDPGSYELYGSNKVVDPGDYNLNEEAGLAAYNLALMTSTWTLIDSRTVTDFTGESAWPRFTKTITPMIFPNEDSYLHYKLLFPTIRDSGSGLMQIAEIELLEKPTNGWPATVTIAPTTEIVVLPENTVSFTSSIIDIDSESHTYEWKLLSGPAGVSFSDTTTADTTVTFPNTKGNYYIQLIVTDSEGNASEAAVARVRVWKPSVDEALIGHWTFNEGPEQSEGVPTEVIHSIAGDDNQGVLGNYNDEHTDPNFVSGWIPGDDVDNYAIEFHDAGYVEVYPKLDSRLDPNMVGLDAGVTVAAWVNAYDWSGNRRICQFGNNEVNNDTDNIFRLLREGDFKFECADGDITVPAFPAGEWHHVAATFDGRTYKLFFDGVEMGSETTDNEQVNFLNDYYGQVLTIGAKNKLVDYGAYPGDYMLGMLDDLRLYSYAISQDTVRELVEMGENSAPVIVSIDAPDDDLVLVGPTIVNLDAEIYDAHLDTINYLWEVVEAPEGVELDIADPTIEDIQIMIDTDGKYVLKLSIDDGVYGIDNPIVKEVTIQAVNASCEKVIADGHGMVADVNNDCYVNIEDFAAIAAAWLECNMPGVDGCTNPYEGLDPIVE